jgi:hypothetical protein
VWTPRPWAVFRYVHTCLVNRFVGVVLPPPLLPLPLLLLLPYLCSVCVPRNIQNDCVYLTHTLSCPVTPKYSHHLQFGIPPETIKDSMKLGIPVPQVYIVPVERFCREMGPALGVNLAEFEFPAYFNFFVYKKRCTLVVDSEDAEENIRRVFSETLLGPAQFRREGENAMTHEPEDFAPDFPQAMIPNFARELKHFRIMPDGNELVIETLLEFRHFVMRSDGHENLGVPPPLEGATEEDIIIEATLAHQAQQQQCELGDEADEEEIEVRDMPQDENAVEKLETKSPWTYSHARFMGKLLLSNRLLVKHIVFFQQPY